MVRQRAASSIANHLYSSEAKPRQYGDSQNSLFTKAGNTIYYVAQYKKEQESLIKGG